MSDNLAIKRPEFAVKFPDVSIPDGYKLKGKWSSYMPVKRFSEAMHTDSIGNYEGEDGMRPVQQMVPVIIELYDKCARRVQNELCGRGILKGKNITCVKFMRNDDDEMTEGFEQELKNVSLKNLGAGTVEVSYQEYEDTSFNGDEAPDEGGFDFEVQKRRT